MHVKRTVEDWLRLRGCLEGDRRAEVVAGATREVGDYGCSDVRDIALGMGLSHATATLRSELEKFYFVPQRKRVTEDMRALEDARQELLGKHLGMPAAEFNRVWADLRAEDRWAQARADEEAYTAADREARAQELTVDLYRMDAARVLRGWAAATAPDADPDASEGTLPLPMRHLATLLEFGILFDPRVERADGTKVVDAAAASS
jgi:hypothetical protein